MNKVSIEGGYDLTDIERAHPGALEAYEALSAVAALVASMGREDFFASVSFTNVLDEGAFEEGTLTSVVWEEKWTGALPSHVWKNGTWNSL